MSEEPYERYIAAFRTLIENHGSQNAIYALEQAFRLESEDQSHTESENKTFCAIANELGELYYKVEKL